HDEDIENAQDIEIITLRKELKDRDNQLATIFACVKQLRGLGSDDKLLLESLSQQNDCASTNNLHHISTRGQKPAPPHRSTCAPLPPANLPVSSIRPRATSAPPLSASSSRQRAQLNIPNDSPVNTADMPVRPKRWVRAGRKVRERNNSQYYRGGRSGHRGKRGRAQSKTVHIHV
ncbi:hypothetical protein PV327_011674, partial [Microctonus hyperodae]